MRLKHGHVFRLVLTSSTEGLHFLILAVATSSPGQDHHGVAGDTGKLKCKCAIKQHDDDTEDPFEDG